MKLFNELKSEHEGVIAKILVEDGTAGRVRPAAVRAGAVIRRVLVANRGEIAVRVIRACHELGIEAVAVYSTADRDSLPCGSPTGRVCIGPPPAAQSYLDVPSVIAAASTTGCDAIHPGYGFLSENAEFVARLRRQRPRSSSGRRRR